MNLPNSPKRSSADDELDQVLNTWAHSDSEQREDSPRHANTINALEFHRWADETLRSEPAAKGPAAGTWNRVLHHVEQKSPKRTAAMSATTAEAASNAAIVYDPKPYNRKEMTMSRFANIAATVAIVFAVSVGGWFAMSQLPPGGDGRFAALQASPEVAQSGTCDVEPLTVDEVMAIVENPYSVAPLDSWGTPPPDEEGVRLAGEGLSEPPVHFSLPANMSAIPDEDEFMAIESAANQYLACGFDGTVGQLMAVMHPIELQYYVLSNFPVYRDQVQIRAFVEDVIELPAGTVSPSFNELAQDLHPQYQSAFATSERPRVRLADSAGYDLLEDQVALVGLDFVDGDGNKIGATDWDATPLLGDYGTSNGGVSLIMVYAEETDAWYFYGFNAPRG